jgi:enamine deaminase RidA (YjgF/YER057c/UK114 family)
LHSQRLHFEGKKPGLNFKNRIKIFPEFQEMKKFLLFSAILGLSIFLKAQNTPLQKLKELGYNLPAVSKPIANYVKWVRVGNLLYTSGHGPTKANGELIVGKLGATLNIEQGYEASKVTALQLLATLQDALGDLGRVKKIVKVLGMVNCTPEFGDQPKVLNGCSDLLVSVFGKHARSAVGMNALPNGMAVEIELVVEIED